LLAKVERLDYHDAESCPDAGVTWLRTASGYVDCTCACDEKAPREVKQALEQAAMRQEALISGGASLDGPIALLALAEGKPTGSNAKLPAWPLIWPLSDIAIEWEAYTRGVRPNARVLTGADADATRMLRAAASRDNAGALRVTDLGQVYNLFMRDELPDAAQSAIARFEAQ
jgi:hypothetical protein